MNDSPVVVKLGGTTIVEQRDVLREIVEERRLRPLVVVHGGGKRLTEWLTRLGVESRWHGGRRVTDEAALEVFLAVIGGVVNAELTEALLALGAPAVGVRGIDHGMIRGPRAEGLGRICNVNADDAAAAVSAALGGELVLMTDSDGVRDAAGERIVELTPDAAAELIEAGVITGGMVPKVHSALRAIAPGSSAGRAIIADGRSQQALRRALHEGAGTGFRLA